MDQTAPDEPPSREELIQARNDLQRQIEILQSPMRGGDGNPPLIAKLRGMLDEINECLTDLESNSA